jgi:heme/copper-type cytochrome/quinol oxidase subunit 1
MFTTVRYFIKTSIAFLLVGLCTGLYMSLGKSVLTLNYGYELVSAHTHIILVGSVMMMIMGVALWFFPRPASGDKQYNPDMIRTVYWMMTIATLLRFVFQCIAAFSDLRSVQMLITFTSFIQIVAMGLFFYSIWGRIRAVGSAQREKNGEKF